MDNSAPELPDSNDCAVLVVDDDVANRLLAVRWLERAGLATRQAEDGEAALAELRRDPDQIGAVLLDVMMPGMSVYDVLAQMQGDPALRPVPVVMLTAHAQQERDVVHGLRSGAVDHLFKPFRGPVLAEKMRVLMRNRQLHLDLRAELQAVKGQPANGAAGRTEEAEFRERLEAEVAFSQRHKSPLSLLIVDVSCDSARCAQDVFLGSCRSSEQPFHISPREFALLLRGADAGSASRARDRVTAALAARVEGETRSGLAVADMRSGFSASDLLRQARANLTASFPGGPRLERQSV